MGSREMYVCAQVESVCNCRDDPVVSFKLWHVCYRTQNADFPAKHPYEKYRANETQVFQSMARMDPGYMGRKAKNDIVFRAGDLRSTYDEELLEKSSDAGLSVKHKVEYDLLPSPYEFFIENAGPL